MSSRNRKVFESDSTIRRVIAVIVCIVLYVSLLAFSAGYLLQIHHNYVLHNELNEELHSLHSPTLHRNQVEYENIFFYKEEVGHSYTTLQEHLEDIATLIFPVRLNQTRVDKNHQDVFDYIEFRGKIPTIGVQIPVEELFALPDFGQNVQNILTLYKAHTVVLDLDVQRVEKDKNKIEQLIAQLQAFHLHVLGHTDTPTALREHTTLQTLDGLIVQAHYFNPHELDTHIFEPQEKEQLLHILEIYPTVYYVVPDFSIAYTTWEKQKVWKSALHSDDIARLAEQKLLYPRYDTQIKATTASYIAEDGANIQLEIADHLAFQDYYLQVHTHPHLRGWGFESPGEEIDSIWNYTQQRNWKSIENQPVRWNIRNQITGEKGEFFQLVADEKTGKTDVSYTTEGEIERAEYTQTPHRALLRKSGFVEGKVALTFDDGPDPITTPLILDWLKEHNLHATFFVVGTQVKQYPAISQRILAEGHTIGNHTTTHPNLFLYNEQEIEEEYRVTQSIIQTATGSTAYFARTPFTAFQSYQTYSSLKNLRAARTLGMTMQEVEANTKDWEAGSEEDITESIRTMLQEERASQILLHDTLAPSLIIPTLNKVISIASELGYSLVNSSELSNNQTQGEHATPSFSISVPPPSPQWLNNFLYFFVGILLLKISLGIALWYRTRLQHKKTTHAAFAPPLSIIIPCYNEERVITHTLTSVMRSKYKNFEVIVVNDGSTDDTSTLLKTFQKKYKRLQVIHQANQGKACALNSGILAARHEIVVCIDADTQVLPTTLINLVQPFCNPKVIAVSGHIEVGNKTSLLTHLQSIEYLVSQIFDKIIQWTFGSVLIVPGALGAFRTSALKKIGLYETDTLAEDADLTLRLHTLKGNICYAPSALAYTESPETLTQLFRQRMRWSYGNLQTAWKNRRLIFTHANPFFRWVFFPIFIVQQLAVPLYLCSFLFIASYILFQLYDAHVLVAHGDTSLYYLTSLSLYTLLYIFMTGFAFVVTKKKLKLQDIEALAISPLYIIYLLAIQLLAYIKALMGVQVHWGNLTRKGNVKLYKTI